MTAFAEAVQKVPKAISPLNLSSTIAVLKELKWEGDIGELLEAYIEGRKDEDANFWDLDENTFGEHVQQPDVRRAFTKKLMSYSDNRDAKTILFSIGQRSGWATGDIEFVSQLSKDDLKHLFKNATGKDLRKLVKGALMFRSVSNATPPMLKLTENAVAALQEIAAESRLNRRRVAKFGVTLPDAEVAQH